MRTALPYFSAVSPAGVKRTTMLMGAPPVRMRWAPSAHTSPRTASRAASAPGADLPLVEAEPGERLDELPLLVGQVRQERVGQHVEGLPDPAEVALVGHVVDQGGVDA